MMFAAQSPNPSQAPDPDLVTPGTIGFLATLAIVIVVIFLIRDALRRVRRVRARAEASDAYPIPLRKHAVPNQSKLSGPDAPQSEAKGAGADDGRDDVSGEQTTGAESEASSRSEGDSTETK